MFPRDAQRRSSGATPTRRLTHWRPQPRKGQACARTPQRFAVEANRKGRMNREDLQVQTLKVSRVQASALGDRRLMGCSYVLCICMAHKIRNG